MAPGIQNGLPVVGEQVLLFGKLPILNAGSLLALAHLGAHGRRLVVGHPARIRVLLGHQVKGIDAFVTLPGGRVHRQEGVAGFPRPLPRGGPGLELFDQLLGHALTIGGL